MELIDVNTQDFQYLTLSQYNGEKKYVRARCEMRKDEPFIQDTSNAFVCIESFRLSCSPNERGIVYRMLPNTYAIQVEKDESSQDTGTTQDLLKTELGYFILAQEGAQQMRFLPSKTKIGATLSINKIVEGMAEDLNPVCVHKGTVMTVDWDDQKTNDDPKVTLLDDPVANIRGPGMGPHGILPCYCRFMRNSSYEKGKYTADGAVHPHPTSRDPDKYQWAQIRINKDDVPNISITHLAIYLSSRVNLYRADFAETETDAYFQVLGPMFMITDIVQQTEVSLIVEDLYYNSPTTQLYCKDTLYKEGGTVFHDSANDDGKLVTVSSKITYLPKWFDDKGDHYLFYLSGVPATVAAQDDLDRSAGRQLWSDTGAQADNGDDDFNFYYIYKQQYLLDTNLFNIIHTASSIQTENTKNQVNAKSDATYKTDIKSRVVTTRRPTLGDPIPSFTPLDMFEKFNTGWKDSAPIQMMTDPNGGFRITVLEDDISTLRVSKQMLFDMGLNTYLTQEGVVNYEPEIYEYKAVVLEVHRVTDDDQIPIYKWQTDYSNPQPLQSYMGIGDIHEFVILDTATGQETGPLRHDTVLPCTVIQTTSGKFYKVIAINYQEITSTSIANQHYEGRSFTAQDGLEYIEWNTPMKGAYIGNDNTVSVGSFSIYENIRLVCTGGMGFQPFIVAGAQEPVLCELRLPFSNSASLFSGDGDAQITITETTSVFYGDIIYQAPASGHQYLRLNSQQPIYDMTIEARLIPRNPDENSEIVMLGFSDVFQVKLRFLMRN